MTSKLNKPAELLTSAIIDAAVADEQRIGVLLAMLSIKCGYLTEAEAYRLVGRHRLVVAEEMVV